MTPSNTGVLIGQTLGDYELLSMLGAGGMAEVYRARDLALGREVAVKVLPASLATDPGYVERFRDEARRVATLDHPNVVPVYHYGEEHGLLYLVMPILKESLRDRMAREGILPPSEAGRIVVQVAAALDAAHNHGIVHRDVKPENILLNSEGKAHLTDFGIAREVEFLRQTGQSRTLAASGLPVGTPEYMAPEQLRGGLVDERADIYALGAVLYELLTGTVPFDGPTPYEVAALVLTSPLLPPSSRNDLIWPDLDHVVMKALERESSERYADARSLAIALRNAVLNRDTKMTRVTIPASSYLKAASAAAPGAVLTLPTSGSLNKPAAAPFIAPQLNLPSTVGGGMDTSTGEWSSPIPVIGGKGKGGRSRSGRSSRRRTWLFIAASALVLVLAVGAGWSVGVIQGLLNASGATSLPGLSGIIASNTPALDATGTAEANVTPGATANPQVTTVPPPGATATPTSISAPTATATAVPSSALVYSDITFPQNSCNGTATQTIKNPGTNSVTWQWVSISPKLKISGWSVTNSAGTYGGFGWPTPQSVSANDTDTLTVYFSCQSGNYTVKVSDNDGNHYFRMNIP